MGRRKPVEYAKARELRSEGWSVKAIAREVGVSQSTVSLWVRDMGPLVFPTTRHAPGAPRPTAVRRGLPVPISRDLQPGGALIRMVVWTSGAVRRCSRCGEHVPLECFNRYGDGRQWWCRRCFTEYFRARGKRHVDAVQRSQRVRHRRNLAHVAAYLADHPCRDCGCRDPVVMEFDHIGEKTATIGELVWSGYPVERIDQEIARCEVVCRNCHRRRTAQRRGELRVTDWRARLAELPPAVARTVEFTYGLLERSACTDCGFAEFVALEFDHVGAKTAGIAVLMQRGVPLDILRAELAQCEVVCGNCHRRRTAARRENAVS